MGRRKTTPRAGARAKAKKAVAYGQAHVHANFTFEKMIDRTEAIYRELVPDR